MTPKAVIISASSDIGYALAKRWRQEGMDVVGTYRTPSSLVEDLKENGVTTIRCDLEKAPLIKKLVSQVKVAVGHWDYLVLCPGVLEPVGAFEDINFVLWAKSVDVNFTQQLGIVHELLPLRNKHSKKPPVVLFFAGGGTNSAPVNYSAYTVSKIALIKMCELLDAEIPDTSFTILGPGWVKTKIHQATLSAGKRAGANFQKTKNKLAGNDCTPIEKVLDCCDWIIKADRRAVSGRNFSVVFDKWSDPAVAKKLLEDLSMYKLRRHGNDG